MPKPSAHNTPKPEPAAPAARPKPGTRGPNGKSTPPPPPKPKSDWYETPGAEDEFMAYIAAGGHLVGFCRERNLGTATMLRWIRATPERASAYDRAREDRADVLADEMVAISDETSVITTIDEETGVVELKLDATAVARNRLRLDARKWVAAKLKPRSYGDKVTQEHVGANGGPIQTTNMDLRGLSDEELAQMQALMAKAASKV